MYPYHIWLGEDMLILGIETSCDETAASVIEDGYKIKSNIISSQFDVHEKYGGIVPELACRKHIENIDIVISAALNESQVSLKDIDLIAVTHGPGLIGSLLVGLSTAKGMAYALNKPLVGINHIEGHIYANFLEEPKTPLPSIALVVSGGHTELYVIKKHCEYKLIGRTRDDAAGEAFDKVAKMLKLGFPGGPIIENLARKGNPNHIEFPRALMSKDSFDFSFSGLKTAVSYYIKKNKNFVLEDVAASFQEALIDVLVTKTIKASIKEGIKDIILAGGVASNNLLRKEMLKKAMEKELRIHIPKPLLCTDNAAMVACAGYYRFKDKDFDKDSFFDFLDLDAVANLRLV
ncbi:MAG TPA: tRNA (adenosine(37)-N6)-threonylcarbamoyltransferase complex transferase subunit TsaD [Nitrospinota bacterium]|nr:tRNA (adenosine(37)-N6)-threonylcarbamoyltransferase complex transferase subunit TsaD [Nitrospinota bacterium]